MVDALGSGPSVRKDVEVRVFSRARFVSQDEVRETIPIARCVPQSRSDEERVDSKVRIAGRSPRKAWTHWTTPTGTIPTARCVLKVCTAAQRGTHRYASHEVTRNASSTRFEPHHSESGADLPDRTGSQATATIFSPIKTRLGWPFPVGESRIRERKFNLILMVFTALYPGPAEGREDCFCPGGVRCRLHLRSRRGRRTCRIALSWWAGLRCRG